MFDIANFTATGTNGNGENIEENYKQMIEEDPSNPLILKSYAQFLYKVNQDLGGAKEYYSRAILADPMDSEALVMYAKLVWQLHHDHAIFLLHTPVSFGRQRAMMKMGMTASSPILFL
ncbi:hypothetical protein BT93_L3919 [Corymbia citriodora subsp. variegata]|uniref:TmcB/TmcC TPR repeats domain-containing protein n=1 Tax=Corymbia citriodora subsp. variegata TaxID=360336 RepID=A0A8T0CGH7_CORYI|nr:hypothetical protein BT93_L3919 [Corymbia citriodora subsp. variegata]